MRRLCLALVVALVPASGPRAGGPTGYEERCAAIAAARGVRSDTDRLHELFAVHWAYTLEEFPEFATRIGVPGHNDRWTDRSAEAIERRRRELEAPARALASIDREALSDADRLSHDLLGRGLDEALEGRRFPDEYLPVSQLSGVQLEAARILAMAPARTADDYADLLARLEALPVLVAQTIALMERGIGAGVVPPRITLDDVPRQILSLLPADPLASPLLGPFTRFPESIGARQQQRLRRRAADAFREPVAPAFRGLHRFVREVYLPAARETIALAALPDGDAWYAFAVRSSTTTRLAPREIHEIGVREVARIARAMEAVVAEARFEGSLPDFMRFLRTDPRFFFDDAPALLAAYRAIAKRADPELPRLFGKLPRLPYGVVPVPEHIAPAQPAAYYEPGSLAAARPGYFYANTYDLPSRPRWAMEPLTLHEAVPGHHLQIALAQELENVPAFRRHASYTAFTEGWGLYAEGLGAEMGFYQDPYARFGRLTFEMWRAVRLVVDTGIHAQGWSREQALAYLQERTGMTAHASEVEVDRYIAWPAQALGYKVGELKLKELRASAERQLGEAFDVRAFHDEVLAEGSLPLDVLEARIRAWVAGRTPGRATPLR
jgi:uncharacterized protein (DUF885 family)